MEYEQLVRDYIGVSGRFQWMIFTIASLDAFSYAFYTIMPVFIAHAPPHWCSTEAETLSQLSNCSQDERMTFAIPQTCDGKVCEYSSCKMFVRNYSALYDMDAMGQPENTSCPLPLMTNSTWNLTEVTCTEWSYGDSFYQDTAAKEWGLVCDREAEAMTIGGIYMLGRLFGSSLLGPLPDTFGRRPVMIGTTAVVFACVVSCAFMTNFYAFLALRFLLALADMSRSSTGFIIGIEFCGQFKRVKFTAYWNLFWASGYCSFAAVAYLLRRWRYLHLVSVLPEIPFFLAYLIFLPESPRWLLLKNRDKEVHKVIESMARCNGSKLPDGWSVVDTQSNEKRGSCLDLFKTPRLRLITIVLAYIFFANSFVYYGFSMNTSNLAGDPFLNCFLSGLVDIPVAAFLYFCYDRFPRVPLFATLMLAAGVAQMLSLTVSTDELWWLTVSMSMVGKLFIAATFLITWLVVTEVFPTAVRGVGLGLTNSAARLAAFVAAYVGMLGRIHPSLPVIVFASSALLAGSLVLILPETRGVVLPQTVDEGERFLAAHMFDICRSKRIKHGQHPEANEQHHPTSNI